MVVLAALAAGLWLLFAKTGPTAVGAAALAQVACKSLEDAHFDMTAKETRSGDDNIYVRQYTFAGRDFRLLAGNYNPNGPHDFRAEWIVKDGVWYERYKTGPNTWAAWEIRAESLELDTGHLPCGDPESATERPDDGSGATGNLRTLAFAPRTVRGVTLSSSIVIDSLGKPVTGLITATDGSKSEITFGGIGQTNVVTVQIALPPSVPTEEPTEKPLDPNIPLLPHGAAIQIVWDHLDNTWPDESTVTCRTFMGDTNPHSGYTTDYLGDRIWQVTAESPVKRSWDESQTPPVWKVRELSATTGEVVESPEFLQAVGCN